MSVEGNCTDPFATWREALIENFTTRKFVGSAVRVWHPGDITSIFGCMHAVVQLSARVGTHNQ